MEKLNKTKFKEIARIYIPHNKVIEDTRTIEKIINKYNDLINNINFLEVIKWNPETSKKNILNIIKSILKEHTKEVGKCILYLLKPEERNPFFYDIFHIIEEL